MIKKVLTVSMGLACSFFLGLASAQLIADDPDWKELDVPPPPAFDLKKLISIDVDRISQLKWGIDPATVKVSADGIVRYVVVAQSSTGVINAMYEGIRCSKAEFRQYARYNADSGWNKVSNTEWRPVRLGSSSNHTNAAAKQGLCVSAAPPVDEREAVKRLRDSARGIILDNQ